MERACRYMEIYERLDNKSDEYRAEFFDGIKYQTDYIFESISSKIFAIKGGNNETKDKNYLY